MTGTIIVGGGHAAGQAAASLRQEGYTESIDIFGDEPHPPYQRPPLSKAYLAGEQGIEKVYLRPETFYASKDITLHKGERIAAIDLAGKRVTTDAGVEHEWATLILATGTRPRLLSLPGSDLAGIHYLRSIADVDGIRAELTSDSKLVIVGGGYIGLEVAAVAAELGAETTVLEMEDRILQRVTTQEMSSFYHELHSARGVNLRVSTGVSGFRGDAEGRVTAALSGGPTGAEEEIAATLVVVGIGVIPNVELAEDAGIDCDNGITVNERCQTSAADVYAIGDCSNHPNPLLGRRLRLESVPNAMEQARVAAANITGKDKTYASMPWFWSDQYELKLQMLGFSADGETTVVRGDKGSNQFAVFYLRDGAIVAVDAVNSPREFMAAKQMVGKTIDPARLADTSVEMKELL